MNTQKSIKGNVLYKIVLFILTLTAGFLTIGALVGIGLLFTIDGLSDSPEEVLKQRQDRILHGYFARTLESLHRDSKEEAQEYVERYLNGMDLDIEIRDCKTGKTVMKVGLCREEDYRYALEQTELFEDGQVCDILVYARPEFWEDEKETWELISWLANNRAEMQLTICAGFLCTFVFLFLLLCSAGHRNGTEGICGTFVTPIWPDVLAGGLALFAVGYVAVAYELLKEFFSHGVSAAEVCRMAVAAGVIPAALLLGGLYDFAVRVKLGKWWRSTLIWKGARFAFRVVRAFGRFLKLLILSVPAFPRLVICLVVICFGEFFLACIICIGGCGPTEAMVLLWFLEKAIVLPFILLLALQYKRLSTAGTELAEGKLEYKVDTAHMLSFMKKHGEDLNRIGEGMGKAVQEKMKSEHLKTELITNVSHDIKTPLTSIINYADLIGKGELTKEETAEYAEVLGRQSVRLKKLLEDLVEASKASTGNLETHPQECAVGVLLGQAAGEYEQRFEQKKLHPVLRIPEKDIVIYADGRHLWRVFDNLLNNICKYAKEDTRVFLSLEESENKAIVTFRNTSEYELETSADELMERFVRGDKSRHQEGSGLGLSIAKSLVELQGGTMEIAVDGDLFKVVLRFSKM